MKLAAAIVGLIARLPIIAIRLVARSRVVLIIVVVAVGYFVISARMSNGQDATTDMVDVPEYQKTAPQAVVAPGVVQTASRVYYVSKLTEDEDTVSLTVWYEYDAGEWVRHSTPLPLNRADIKFYKRGTK